MSKAADPSFFKVLSTMDFTELLRLPPAASRKYELYESEDVKLRSHSGRRWSVKVERRKNNGQYCFITGWKSFAEDAALQLGEFIVFSQLAKSEFVVEIFTTNFCQRHIPPPIGRNDVELATRDSSSSNEIQGQTPSFMMFGLRDFGSELCIPVKFVAKYKQVKDQERMFLETDAGKGREVKIRKDKNEDYYMEEGWADFMEDNEVDDMDFLVFRLVGDSTFNVEIYRGDGCLKEPMISVVVVDENESGSDSEGEIPKMQIKGSNPLYFEKTLDFYQRSRINLPNEFSKAANMKKKTHVKLEFVATHHCETVVVNPQANKCRRVDLANGWPTFREANGLVFGKTYSFEFNPQENFIHVREVIRK